LTVMRVTNSNH